jgi:hypothetical protein
MTMTHTPETVAHEKAMAAAAAAAADAVTPIEPVT